MVIEFWWKLSVNKLGTSDSPSWQKKKTKKLLKFLFFGRILQSHSLGKSKSMHDLLQGFGFFNLYTLIMSINSGTRNNREKICLKKKFIRKKFKKIYLKKVWKESVWKNENGFKDIKKNIVIKDCELVWRSIKFQKTTLF